MLNNPNSSFIEDKKGRSRSFYYKKKNVVIDTIGVLKFLKKLSNKNHEDIRICFHASYNDKLQDMMLLQHKKNFYKPHKHTNGYDTYSIKEGVLGVVIFSNVGKITKHFKLEKNNIYKTPINKYHVTFPLTTRVIYHEYKSGKFNRITNCKFPKWCPKNTQEIKTFKLLLNNKFHEKN
tara:strand:- start:6200 stop:6733 length:534 start_codon:yes stop_codon:yes gene_type:complete